MLTQLQRTSMKQFRAVTPQGVEFVKPSRYDEITCAVVIYPLENGDGLFRTVQVDWYTNREQAERHAKDWRNFGHHVEIVPASSC